MHVHFRATKPRCVSFFMYSSMYFVVIFIFLPFSPVHINVTGIPLFGLIGLAHVVFLVSTKLWCWEYFRRVYSAELKEINYASQ